MTSYSVQPRDRMFVKGYGFLSFAKNMAWNICKTIEKNLSSKYSQKILNHAKNLLQMHLKLFQKEQLKKQQRQMVIWLTIKSLTKLRKFQKLHQRIIQKQMKK